MIMRKRYEIFRAAQDELNEQIQKHARMKLRYKINSRELAAFIKGCNYILFRIRKGTIDPDLLNNTKTTNTKAL